MKVRRSQTKNPHEDAEAWDKGLREQLHRKAPITGSNEHTFSSPDEASTWRFCVEVQDKGSRWRFYFTLAMVWVPQLGFRPWPMVGVGWAENQQAILWSILELRLESPPVKVALRGPTFFRKNSYTVFICLNLLVLSPIGFICSLFLLCFEGCLVNDLLGNFCIVCFPWFFFTFFLSFPSLRQWFTWDFVLSFLSVSRNFSFIFHFSRSCWHIFRGTVNAKLGTLCSVCLEFQSFVI